jgi:hypothetical protein
MKMVRQITTIIEVTPMLCDKSVFEEIERQMAREEVVTKETKFTPGPWKWWTSCSWKRLKTTDRNETVVLEPYASRSDNHPDCMVSDADMALIAAAPELYEALQRALDMVDTDYGPPNWDWIRGVLKKARGETP